MDSNIATGTAQAGRSPAFRVFANRSSHRWRTVYRMSLTLLSLMLGAGVHLSSSGGRWFIAPPAARADDVQYAYDELGRLIQASDPSTGQAILYTYDAVGNITSQITTSLTNLSIGYFTPNHGPIGTQVTLTGTGFSPTSSADFVTFNGVAATVVSASQTRLVLTVPPAATNGPISVSIGSSTATSHASFTVTAYGDGPVITGLDPPVGTAGQFVTVIGTGFESQPADNRVRFDATSALVSASTSTAITTSVPAGSNSGKVYLTTPRGMAASPMDFIVVPSGYSAGSIGTTGRMTTDGSTAAISIPAANKIAVELFDGKVGDLLTIGVGSTTLASATLKVFNPDGSQLTSGTVTYTIVIDPGSNTGTLALDIVRPILGTLALNGAPTPLVLAPPGQRALLTFSGTQGTYANVTLSAVTVSAGTVSVIGPNGGVVDSESFTTAGTSLQPQLPATGTYTVLINPTGSLGGSLSVALTTSTSPTLSLDQGYNLTLANTTPVSLSFDGSAGQYLALSAATTRSGIGSYTVSVLAPDGTHVTSGTLSTSSGTGSMVLNIGPLALGGTYSAIVQANGSGSGVVTLTLSTPQTGVLATDGSSASAAIGIAGQGLLYSSALTAGQYLSFAVSEPNPGRHQRSSDYRAASGWHYSHQWHAHDHLHQLYIRDLHRGHSRLLRQYRVEPGSAAGIGNLHLPVSADRHRGR
jgi:YD repeat-containing protein